MELSNCIEKLIKKLNNSRTSMLGEDFLEIVPGVNEANEYLNSIAKF